MFIVGALFLNYVSAFFVIFKHFTGNAGYKATHFIFQFCWNIFNLVCGLTLISTGSRVSNKVNVNLNVNIKDLRQLLCHLICRERKHFKSYTIL